MRRLDETKFFAVRDVVVHLGADPSPTTTLWAADPTDPVTCSDPLDSLRERVSWLEHRCLEMGADTMGLETRLRILRQDVMAWMADEQDEPGIDDEDPGKCGECGMPYELIRPGKSQETCRCEEVRQLEREVADLRQRMAAPSGERADRYAEYAQLKAETHATPGLNEHLTKSLRYLEGFHAKYIGPREPSGVALCDICGESVESTHRQDCPFRVLYPQSAFLAVEVAK